MVTEGGHPVGTPVRFWAGCGEQVGRILRYCTDGNVLVCDDKSMVCVSVASVYPDTLEQRRIEVGNLRRRLAERGKEIARLNMLLEAAHRRNIDRKNGQSMHAVESVEEKASVVQFIGPQWPALSPAEI